MKLGLGVTGLSALSFKSLVKAKDIEGSFVHMVYFWLKDPDDQKSRDKFIKELTKFTDKVKEIERIHIGYPADTSRPVIDSSWTYSLVVTFSSKAAHDVYQEHDAHKKFIENASNLWNRVQIYDSELMK